MKPEGTDSRGMQPENELLLRLTRISVSDEDLGRIYALVRGPLDWDHLAEIADDHRLIPGLHHRLQLIADRMPEGTIAVVRKRFREIADTNLALSGKLIKLMGLLREHNIPAIPYKGPTLAQAAYGDIRLRQYSDLDILVRKQDVHRVKDLFLANGCEPGWCLSAAEEAAVLRHSYAYPILCNDRRVLVEVHWAFAEQFFSFAFDLEQIWNRLAPVTILGKTLVTLSSEDLLLTLCAHGSKHLWERLGWVADVAHLISRRTELNWDLLFERATALGLYRIVWLGLILAVDLLGAKLPDDLTLKHPVLPDTRLLAVSISDAMFDGSGRSRGTLQLMRLHLRMRERMKDKLNYCFRLIVTTKLVDSLFMPMGRPR